MINHKIIKRLRRKRSLEGRKRSLESMLLEINMKGSHGDVHHRVFSNLSLDDVKLDVFSVLDRNPDEVKGLLKMLNKGKINGRSYTGECACLIGTIANIRGWHISRFERAPDRPAEQWFFGIEEYDKPSNSLVAAQTAEWIKEWLATNKVKDGMQ